ncbi:MAG: bifunctional [glutamate--ammonia ligase]-adenylyl-L-tyrosine phosphorylase/[glutamate--ammonia-ligase] adenylyltransferase [Nitrospirae bacterium]|nr:bifunctional [glutamate--ammonia ligase]-adenylyl-L-tyrosine phosphorylase/[glutamate--ammonia-ligase] adenylyltransferase [Nitrospirota bacterium]
MVTALQEILDPSRIERSRSLLADIGFDNPDLALKNLARLAGHAERAGLDLSNLPALLDDIGASADPDQALNFIERMAAVSPEPSGLLSRLSDAVPARRVAALLGGSSFLAGSLLEDPDEWIEWLSGRDLLDHARDVPAMLTDLDSRIPQGASVESVHSVLRRFHRREMVRIALRDLLGAAPLPETAGEISALAEACVRAACRTAWDFLSARHGTPRFQDDSGTWRISRFAVIGMGKLGGKELNVSSDIDLIFACSSERGDTTGVSDPDGDASGRIGNHLFFTRMAETIIRLIGAPTEDGMVFRIDTRLRPEGEKGDLVSSLRSYEIYYESWGKTWERAALIKARPIAGDASLGEEFLTLVRPFVYRKYLDFGALTEIRDMKFKIDQSLAARRAAGINIKLGTGGIREIEFLAQAFQLIYGGRDPSIRERSTVPALRAIARRGMLSSDERDALVSAYYFLRSLEHRIQFAQFRQTHDLPTGDRDLRVLARRMGYRDGPNVSAAERLMGDYRRHTKTVRTIFDHLLTLPPEGETEDLASEILHLVRGEMPKEEALDLLGRLGFSDPPAALRNLRLLTEGPPLAHYTPGARRLILQILPEALPVVLRSADPDSALARIEAFTEAMGARESFYSVLRSHPKTLDLLVTLFAGSAYLAQRLIAQPELFDLVFLEADLLSPKDAPRLRRELASLLASAASDEDQARLLRRFVREEEIRIGLRDLVLGVGTVRTGREIARVAETSLQAAADLAWSRLIGVYGRPMSPSGQPCPYAIFAAGKLGGRDMLYSSDLDLVYLYAEEGDTTGGTRKAISNREFLSKLAERIFALLGEPTGEGIAFRVDTRLRPTGSKGPVAVTLNSALRYYASEAEVWERLAMTRLRAVAGDSGLARLFLDGLSDTVYSRPPAGFREAVAAMRRKMEEEAGEAREGVNIKAGRGGIVDVEFIAQGLILEHGGSDPWLRVPNTLTALRRLRRRGHLPPAAYRDLSRAYLFLRHAENRLRIVHNISSNVLPNDPAQRRLLARRMGYPDDALGKAEDKLARDLALHTSAARRWFNEIFEVSIEESKT